MEYALFFNWRYILFTDKTELRQVSKYSNDNIYLKLSISAYKDLIKAFTKIKVEKAQRK